MEANKMKEFRTKLYTDLYSNKIPERVPVNDGFGIEYHLKYAGMDLMLTQYSLTTEKIVEAMDKVREFARGDVFTTGSARNAVGAMLQKSNMDVMSKSGFVQHPESATLYENELDDYIQSPYDVIQKVMRPRSYPAYVDDPFQRCFNYMRFFLANQDFNRTIAEANRIIAEKYGLLTTPAGTSGRAPVAFDNLADRARGFTQILTDIKRCPQKILDAMDAFMPYAIHVASKSKPHILGSNAIMTHMGVFLRNKEFDKFYWPKFNEIVHVAAERGQATTIFCEGDWTRFLDEMTELPMGTRLYMEYGDMQKFKDKLGKNCVLGGFYPLTLLKNGTKEQCVDKAKEVMDIMAPGGNYFFRFDKAVLDTNDMDPEKYTAVMDYVFEHGKYENAGETISQTDKDSTIIKGIADKYPKFKANCIASFEEWVKDYPPADERAVPLMKAAYDKYTAMTMNYFM